MVEPFGDTFFFAGISPDKASSGRARAGVGVSVRVRLGGSGGVLGVLNDISSHNTGTTRGPHDIPRIPC